MVRLKEIREEKELSQTELARKSGVSRQTIINIEKGHFDGSKETMEKLSRALDTTIDNIFFA